MGIFDFFKKKSEKKIIDNELDVYKANKVLYTNVKWYDTNTYMFLDFKPSELDYGQRHFESDGSLCNGMHKETYKSKKSPITREIHGNDIIFLDSWAKPTYRGIFDMLGTLRKFILGNRIDRKVILFQKMGFDEVGVAVSQNPDEYLDALYVYQFSNEPSQMEIFISTHEEGFITEINRYNHISGEEVKIPNTVGGIEYMFYQIFGDINKINVNKFDISSVPEKVTIGYTNLLNFNTPMYPIDDIKVESIASFNTINR